MAVIWDPFSYASHNRFWLEVCDISVNTYNFPGTTREHFEKTLFEANAENQAAALRAVLEEYPPNDEPDPDRPKFRSAKLHREILGWISRLEIGQVAVEVEVQSSSEVVHRKLDDAANLLRSSGPQSAVDRVHTALHGYLHSLCQEIDVQLDGRPSMNKLFKALRASHPAFADVGTRGENVNRMLGSFATILDALNPIRNNASAVSDKPPFPSRPR